MEMKVSGSCLGEEGAAADEESPGADMAEFTGAKESIPLGKKANKEAAQKLRTGMIDMIHDAEEEEDDEEAREWELAQIRRGEQGRETMMQVSCFLSLPGRLRLTRACRRRQNGRTSQRQVSRPLLVAVRSTLTI